MAGFLFRNEKQEVIAILDESGNQLFDTVGVISLSAAPSRTYAEHTLENGVNITDHSYRNNDAINISVILDAADYVEVYEQIKEAHESDTPLTVQTRVDVHDNMYIRRLPREESAAISDTISLTFELTEQQFQDTEFGSLPESEVASPSDSTTKSVGNKQAQPTGSAATQIADKLRGFF